MCPTTSFLTLLWWYSSLDGTHTLVVDLPFYGAPLCLKVSAPFVVYFNLPWPAVVIIVCYLTIVELTLWPCVENRLLCWCHRHKNRRLSSRPHSHESGIFFPYFCIHSFYATATLLNIWICMNMNIWICMQWTDAADGGGGGRHCDVNSPSLWPRGNRSKAVANDHRQQYHHGCGLWTLVHLMMSLIFPTSSSGSSVFLLATRSMLSLKTFITSHVQPLLAHFCLQSMLRPPYYLMSRGMLSTFWKYYYSST